MEKKEKKKWIKTFSITLITMLVIIGGLSLTVYFAEKGEEKEVETSAQPQNTQKDTSNTTTNSMQDEEKENTLKEDKNTEKEESNENKTLITKEMLQANDYKLLFENIKYRIACEEYSLPGDVLNLAVRHQIGNKFIVSVIIESTKHITNPDYPLKSSLNSRDYAYMYYIEKGITKEKIYYACFELNDNVYLEDIANNSSSESANVAIEMTFNIEGEHIINIDNSADDYTVSQIAQSVADKLDGYYEKAKNNEPIE